MKQSRESTVVQAVRGMSKNSDSLVSLSNGVVLKVRKVPNMIFLEVMHRFTPPKVPVVMNEDLGRKEENPNDPTYVDEYNRYQADLSMAIVDTMVLMGTSVYSVPEEIDGPSDESWSRKLKILHIVPGEDEMERYLMWVKYYAAEDDTDITKIVEAVGRLSGVSEEDVAQAVGQFRDIP